MYTHVCVYIYIYIYIHIGHSDAGVPGPAPPLLSAAHPPSNPRNIYIYIYNVYTHIYIYIYMYVSLSLSLSIYLSISLSLYTYNCIYIYIYIYIHIHTQHHATPRLIDPEKRSEQEEGSPPSPFFQRLGHSTRVQLNFLLSLFGASAPSPFFSGSDISQELLTAQLFWSLLQDFQFGGTPSAN